MDKYIGRLLDNRYEILEMIGVGGMAVVYKARCHRLNRLVAIKILKDDYLQDEEFRRRFHSESQAVAMLSHPNIVSVYDVSTSLDADYIVMELIDGITLKQYMEKKGVLNWKETLHFAIQIAKALEHAHGRGIVHRDIKPHNVMVLKNGSVKVTDFGIARMMSQGNTLTKEALGSVHYISPEQAKGGRVDSRSDIYSLGVVMYEMMSGRPPYDGESPVAVAIQHINGGAAMPSTFNPNIPGGLEQIIMKAMAHAIGDRYDSAAVMLADMDEFRKNPSMLFDYNMPPLDDVIKLQRPPLILEQTPERTTAERVAQRAERQKRTAPGTAPIRRSSGVPQQKKGAKSGTKRKKKAKSGGSRTALIAIIVCTLVSLFAVGVIIWVLNSGFFDRSSQLVKVPELLGKVYVSLPEYEDFTVVLNDNVYDDTVPAGKIVSQKPDAGIKVSKGTVIHVDVSKGKAPPEAVFMPDVVKSKSDDVVNVLKSLSVKPDVQIKPVYDETVPEGHIVSTEPEKGTELKAGDKIVLHVSMGKAPVNVATMPGVVGYAKASAEQTILGQGVKVTIDFEETYDFSVAFGKVISTDPVKGGELKDGQTVTVYISKGPQMGKMPPVTGISIDLAYNLLNAADFKNYTHEMVESNEKNGTVIGQNVEAGEEIPLNALIILQVSKGPAETTAPTQPEQTTVATEPEQTRPEQTPDQNQSTQPQS